MSHMKQLAHVVFYSHKPLLRIDNGDYRLISPRFTLLMISLWLYSAS